jgi:hypothetical protein
MMYQVKYPVYYPDNFKSSPAGEMRLSKPMSLWEAEIKREQIIAECRVSDVFPEVSIVEFDE